MEEPAGSDEQITIRIDAIEDAEERDEMYRRLRNRLESEDIETSFATEAAPAGSKADLGIVTSLVVPLLTSSIPIVAERVFDWAKSQRTKVRVVVERGDGTAIHIDNVEHEDVAEVLAEWGQATDGAIEGV